MTSMRKITSAEGKRTKTGYHTGHAVFLHNGVYYIAQESGTRRATALEIKNARIDKRS